MPKVNWRRAAPVLLAALAGALAGLAHPPFGLLPGLLGFALLLHLLDRVAQGEPLRSAFLRAWTAGFTYFLVGTWWVGEAFMVDAAAHGWQAPFAVTLLPGGLALFWGAGGALYRRFAPAHAGRILFFAAVFALAEWLRGHALTGFPWDLPGATWKAGSPVSQVASLVGVYGLTVVTLAIAAAPAVLWRGDSRRTRIAVLAPAVLALAAMWGWGAWRLSRPAPADTAHTVRIVQGAIPQATKWSPSELRSILDTHLRLTAAPVQGRIPDIVIWPEAAVPLEANEALTPQGPYRALIAAALQPGQSLLMGTYRIEGTYEDPAYYNSLVAVRRGAPDLAVTGLYDKHHLVPFGEYMPLERWLEPMGLKKLVSVGESFRPGPRPAAMAPDGVPRFVPLICYESLFPALARRAAAGPAGPEWIVNVSNDSWFGATSGPWQHLNLASYRAIETGLPLVRATPTGVSAVVDALGRPRAYLPLGKEGIIDAALPAPSAATLYSRLGEVPFWLFLLVGLAFGWQPPRKR